MEVALIGKGEGRNNAPLKGEGVTTWGVNDLVAHREVDVCFWMDKAIMENTQMDDLVKLSVNKTKTKTYCTKYFDDIPTSVPYPYNEIVDFFGTDYFNDSCCYMVALAIYQGFSTISLYGFDYAWGNNYDKEKPAVSFWLGMAVGLGRKVKIHGKYAELLKTSDGKVYSYLTDQKIYTDVKLKFSNPPQGDVSFSVADRVAKLGLLPLKGTYHTMKFCEWFRSQLLFPPEENKKLNFRTAEEDGESLLVWDNNLIPDKLIQLNDSEKSFLATLMNKLDRQGMINKENIKLYEKFCLPEIKHGDN